MYYMLSMAGILERMRRSRKKLVSQRLPLDTYHPKVLELQTAKELLAETFGISVLEVEEMILLRCEEKEMWPESFSLE
jgi:hypothetical protein